MKKTQKNLWMKWKTNPRKTKKTKPPRNCGGYNQNKMEKISIVTQTALFYITI